ncbi:MAG: asparagine synthase (glutamine-hydrolyzing) [Bacteroidetes bacterium]|nr:asparagine synthase (glutamine-hydrolyzing) [Bacteroidota bacterium]
MCGIAGVIQYYGVFNEYPALERMSEAIAHRGPDGNGEWVSQCGKVALVHRRLSILDLSNQAAQPMFSFDQRYAIVFNGEIYNYLELRDELEKKGVKFKTKSDTEVLLNCFINDPSNFLETLDGMFAFAIWDDLEKKMFCARDRFGEKPFYFYRTSNQFIFGSEIKAIFSYLGRLEVKHDMIQSYLSGADIINDSSTFFNDVETLLPAHYFTIDKNEFKLSRYWDIDLDKKAGNASPEDYIEEFSRLFKESIRYRLRSDVPIGSSLSGGLDSSAVVCSLSGLDLTEMHTFSARFDGPKDEGKWIKEVVEKTHVKSHEVWPSAHGFASELDQLIWHHEFPPGSSSVYAQWCVMKLVHQSGVKVLLDGQGADEYLAGYDELKYFAIWEHYRKGKWKNYFEEKKLFNLNYGNHASLGYAYLFDNLLDLFSIKRKVYSNGKDLHQILKHYTTTKLGELLRYADRNSMAHSVEVRLPFLYYKLVEFVFSLPTEMIYSKGKTKYILREAVRNEIPPAIFNRTDKIGFAPPQQLWMEDPAIKMLVDKARIGLLDKGFKIGENGFSQIAAWSFINKFSA